jgi:hypothetical protein
MANIKMFGLVGVGSDIQFGKGGPRIQRSTSLFRFRQSDGTTFTRVQIATPVDPEDATTKAYVDSANGSLQTELNTTQTGAGLNTDGTYPTITGTNYLNATTSLRNADAALDTALGNVQTELNTTQTGAGLNADGTYPTITGTNYLNATTSLRNADAALDTALAALQTEVNTTQTGAGLNTNGSYATHTGTNYLNTSTSLRGADILLDTAIAARAAEITDLDTRLDTVEAAYINRNGSVAFTANQSMGGFRLTNLAAPTTSTDAATRAYVDSAVSSLGSVFNYVGTVAGGATAGAPTNLSALSGISVGDYYVVSTAGWFIFTTGTAFYANLGDGIVKNTTANGWDKIDNTDSTVAGTANRIAVTGNVDLGYTLDIASTYLGQTSITTLGTITTGTWTGTTVGTAFGGTGQTTYAVGDLLVGTAGSLTRLPRGTASQVLRTNAAGTNLEYAALIAADVGVSNPNWSGTNLNAVLTEIDTRADGIQSELDASQTAIGLNTNGTFQTFTGTNYLNATTTIRGGLIALDTQVQTVANNLANLSSNEIESADTRTSVRVTDAAGIEFFDEVSATKTKVGGIVAGNSTNTTFEIDLTTAGEVRFEANGTNPNLRLVPAGTGRVVIGSGAAGTVQADTGQNIVLRGGDNGAGAGGNVVLRAGDGSSSDGFISFQQGTGSEIARITSGTGTTSLFTTTVANTGVTLATSAGSVTLTPGAGGDVSVSNARITNLATPTAGGDATNRTYVDGLQVAKVETRQVTLTETTGTYNIGSVVTGEVARVIVTVTTPFTTGATITVGRTGATAELMTATLIDEAAIGSYVNDSTRTYGTSTQLVAVVTAGSGSTGAAKVLVEYARA